MPRPPALRKYQKRAVSFLKKNNGGAVFLRPGAGKTAITLTYLRSWFKENPEKKVLVIGPLNVVYDAWEEEPKKWFSTLKVFNLHREAYQPGYQLYLINPNQFVRQISNRWMREFSGLIVDESTMFKTVDSQRTEKYHRFIDVVPLEMSMILTGTPYTKNLLDIYCPYYAIDRKRLGPDYYFYRGKFFEPDSTGRKWEPKEGAQEEIVRRLSHKSFILTEKEEAEIGYPETVFNDLYFKLDPKNWKIYSKFQQDLILELDTKTIDKSHHANKVYTGAVTYNYCSQFVQGNFYEPVFKKIPHPKKEGETKLKKVGNNINFAHNLRLDVLKNLLDVLNGDPLFVIYNFTSDLTLFKKLKLKPSEYAIVKGGMSPTEVKAILKKWNEGKLICVFAQIKTVSHGLNLQFGGSNICYFSCPDDYELYFQSLHRLVRPGARKRFVTIHRIICRYTVDEIRRLQILEGKEYGAKEFNTALRNFSKRMKVA